MSAFAEPIPPLFRWHEFHAHWRADLDTLAGRTQPSCRCVDAKNDDGVRTLIFSQEPLASRIDGEIARSLALRQFVLHVRKPTRFFANGEDDDAIVTAV